MENLNQFTSEQLHNLIKQLNEYMQIKEKEENEKINLYEKKKILIKEYFGCANFRIETIENLLQDDDYNKIITTNETYIIRCINRKSSIISKFIESKYYNLGSSNNYAIRHFVKINNIEQVKQLLQDSNVDPSVNNNDPIYYTCTYGCLDMVKLLLQQEKVKISVNYNKAFQRACYGRNIKIAKYLLNNYTIDPSADNNEAILLVSKNANLPRLSDESDKYYDIIKLLLEYPEVDPSANNNFALNRACHHKNIKVIQILLKDDRIDPSINNNEILEMVATFNQTEVVQMLIKHPKVNSSDDIARIISKCQKSGFIEMAKILYQSGKCNVKFDFYKPELFKTNLYELNEFNELLSKIELPKNEENQMDESD